MISEVKYTLIIIYSTICIFGTSSNTIAMVYLFKQWKTKQQISNSQKILMSLIMSDFLVSAVCCPIRIIDSFVKLSTHGYVFSTLCGASSLTIFLLAFDKYLKLTRFCVYEDIMTNKRLMISIGTCWIFPTVAMTSAWWFIPMYGMINGLITCLIFVSLPIFYFLIYRYYKQSKRNLAKFSQTVSSTNVSRVVQAQSSNDGNVNTDRHRQSSVVVVMSKSVARNQKNQRRLTKKILLLMSTYFICTIIYSPIAYLASFQMIDHSTLFYLSNAVYLANSMLNPIIYVFRDVTFRRTVKEMFGMQRRNSTVASISPVISRQD